MKTQFTLFALTLLLAFSSCKKELFTPSPQSDPVSVFEYLWEDFDNNYAQFEQRGIDWDAQYDTYRPQVNENTTDDELADIFRSMLRVLEDGHVQMIILNEKVFYSNSYFDLKIEDELFDLNLIKSNYLNEEYAVNGYDLNTYGWLENNIGYVHTVWTTDNWEDMDEILEYFDSADGLVFDLRHNAGGDFTEAFSRFGRFMDQERLIFTTETKNGNEDGQFSDPFGWKIAPEGDYFDKPIVILTDRYTMSATERLTMAFQTLPNVTTIGDTTNGSISTKCSRELANGWYYSIAPEYVTYHDGIIYEGLGMIPDIISENTAAEMASGQDKALEEAIAHF